MGFLLGITWKTIFVALLVMISFTALIIAIKKRASFRDFFSNISSSLSTLLNNTPPTRFFSGLEFTLLLCSFVLVIFFIRFGTNTLPTLQYRSNLLSGGDIRAIAVNPEDNNKVIIGTFNGIYFSKDGGRTWDHTLSGNLQVHSIAVSQSDPNIVIAGTGYGIAISSNKGATWQILDNESLNKEQIYAVSIDTSSSKVFYAGTDGGGVFKSIDRGISWQPINSGLANLHVATLTTSPLDPNVIFCGTNGGLYKSNDGGVSWNLILDETIRAFTLASTDGSILFAASPDRGFSSSFFIPTSPSSVFVSRDGGESWKGTNNFSRVFGLSANHISETIYATSIDDGIMFSQDYGMTWENISSNLPTNGVWKVAIDPINSNKILIATSRGVYVSENKGGSWTEKNSGLDSISFVSLSTSSANNSSLMVGLTNTGIMTSNDEGENWLYNSSPTNYDFPEQLVVDPLSQSHWLALGVDGIYETTSSGSDWNKILNETPAIIALDYWNSKVLYLGYENGDLKKYHLSEKSLTPIQIDITLNSPNAKNFTKITAIEFNPLTAGTIYIGGEPLGIIRSTDFGVSWEIIHTIAPVAILNTASQPQYLYSLISAQPFNYSEIYRSPDQGDTWSNYTDSATTITTITQDLTNPNGIFGGTTEGEVVNYSYIDPYALSLFDSGLWGSIFILLGFLSFISARKNPLFTSTKGLKGLVSILLSIFGLLIIKYAQTPEYRENGQWIILILLVAVIVHSLDAVFFFDFNFTDYLKKQNRLFPPSIYLFVLVIIISYTFVLATHFSEKYELSLRDFFQEMLLWLILSIYYWLFSKADEEEKQILNNIRQRISLAGMIIAGTGITLSILLNILHIDFEMATLFAISFLILTIAIVYLFYFEQYTFSHILKRDKANRIQKDILGAEAERVRLVDKLSKYEFPRKVTYFFSEMKSKVIELRVNISKKTGLATTYFQKHKINIIISIVVILTLITTGIRFATTNPTKISIEESFVVDQPPSLSSSIIPNGIQLIWEPATDPRVKGYHIYVGTNENAIDYQHSIATVNAPNHEYNFYHDNYWVINNREGWGIPNPLHQLASSDFINSDTRYNFSVRAFGENGQDISPASTIVVYPFSKTHLQQKVITQAISNDNIIWGITNENQFVQVGQSGFDKNPIPNPFPGITSNNILSIQSDSNDNLWVFTKEGINRIGDQITQYPFATSLMRMPAGTINVLIEGPNHLLWVGSTENLVGLDKEGWNIPVFSTPTSITSSTQADDGQIWFGTDQGEIFKYQNDTFESIPTKFGLNEISFLLIDSKEDLWGVADNKLAKLHKNEWQFIELDESINVNSMTLWHDKPILATNNGIYIVEGQKSTQMDSTPELYNSDITYVATDNNGNLWLSSNNSLYHLNNNEGWSKHEYDVSILDNSLSINALCADKDGNVWIGTNDGLIKFDGNKFEQFSNQTEEIVSVLASSNGTIWVGGENRISSFSDNKWVNYHPQSFSPKNFGNMTEDKEGELWVPSNDGLLHWDEIGWRVFNELDGLHDAEITSVFIDIDGVIWATSEKGFSHWNGENWEKFGRNGLPYHHEPPMNSVYSIIENESGIIWFIQNNKITNLNNNIWQTEDEYLYNGPQGDSTYDSAIIDSTGGLWVGSDQGVKRFFNDHWETFSVLNSNLVSDQINVVFQGSKGGVWFGTDMGLSYFDGVSWTTYNTSNSGLPGNNILQILEDQAGNLWVQTNLGIASYDGSNFIPYVQDSASWTLSSDSFASAPDSWSIAANPTNKQDDYASLISQPIQVSETTSLSFTQNYEFNYSSYGSVQISLDNGNSWIELKRLEGQTDNWEESSYDLAPYLTDPTLVILRFVRYADFSSNTSTNIWHIDDVKIGGEIVEFNSSIPASISIPGNTVTAMAADATGNLWVATTNGLSKFDGENWELFDESDPNIPDSEINIITPTQDGQVVWFVFNNNEVSRFDGSNWLAFPIEDMGFSGSSSITTILPTSKGIWVGTNQGLAYFDGTTWKLFTEENSELSSNAITSLFLSSSEILWVGTSSGLASFDGDNWISHQSREFKPTKFGKPFEDPDGVIWLPSDYGLLSWSMNSWKIHSDKDGFNNTAITSLFLDNTGTMVAITDAGFYRRKDNQWIEDEELSNFENISAIFSNPNGEYWIGSQNNGVLHLDKDLFPTIYRHYTLQKEFYDIQLDNKNQVWLATDNGVALFDETNTWQIFDQLDGLKGEPISWLVTGNDESVWAYSNETLYKFNGTKWIVIPPPNADISLLLEFGKVDGFGRMWAKSSTGIVMYDGKEWTTYESFGDISLARTKDLFIDSSNRVWFFVGQSNIDNPNNGTSGIGLISYDNDNWSLIGTQTDSLLSDDVLSVLEDRQGRLWVGTSMGISIFDGKDWQILHNRDELVGLSIYSIAQDYTGNLWFGTDNGLGFFDGKNWYLFSPFEGLPDEPIKRIIINSDDDDMWLLSENHLTWHQITPRIPENLLFGFGIITCVFLGVMFLAIPRIPAWKYPRLYRKFSTNPKSFYIDLHTTIAADFPNTETISYLAQNARSQNQNQFSNLLEAITQILRNPFSKDLGTSLINAYNEMPEDIFGQKEIKLIYTAFEKIISAESITELGSLHDSPNIYDAIEKLKRISYESEEFKFFPTTTPPATFVAYFTIMGLIAGKVSDAIKVNERASTLSYLVEAFSQVNNAESLTPAFDYPEQIIARESLLRWRAMIQRHMERIRGGAEVTVQLLTKRLVLSRSMIIVFQLENIGFGNAENLHLELVDVGGSKVLSNHILSWDKIDPQQQVEADFEVQFLQTGTYPIMIRGSFSDQNNYSQLIQETFIIRVDIATTSFKKIEFSPYVAGKPIDPNSRALFVGREDIFEWISHNLKSAGQNNILVLYGQRRMGKTSILNQIKAGRLGKDYIGVFLDLENLADPGTHLFLLNLCEVIADATNTKSLVPAFRDFEKAPYRAADQYLKNLDNISTNASILILFDEFHVLANRVSRGLVSEEVFGFLRSQLQTRKNLAFVLVGTHELRRMVKSQSNILFSIAQLKEIDYLSEKDAFQLIRDPAEGILEYDDYAIKTILRATYYHPYLIQLVCAELIQLVNSREETNFVSAHDVRKVLNTLATSEGIYYFSDEWAFSTVMEQRTILAISELVGPGYSPTNELSITQKLVPPSTSQEVHIALDSLTERKILIRSRSTSGGYTYQFAINLFRDWTDKHHGGRSL